jgi:predicted SnoaL-like aldol condensation-catalyzing enzyme
MDREATRQLVLDFYDLFVNQRDFDSAVRYLGEPYVQHRADIPSDMESLRAFNVGMRQKYPHLRADVRRVFVDGDYVILHVHVVPEPGQRGSAHVDIFRTENGKIVEHWDVDEPIPEQIAHDNPVV